jgi:catechol 2,3-dioxygenase-like lactoylglutathione lyase family enzyme
MSTYILAIDHVQIAAPEGCEEKARVFYGEILGLEELEVPLGLRDRASCWFRCGQLQMHIGIQQDFQASKKAHVAFLTTRIDGLREVFQLHGITTVDDGDLPGARRFFTEDPWGNRLEFLERTS